MLYVNMNNSQINTFLWIQSTSFYLVFAKDNSIGYYIAVRLLPAYGDIFFKASDYKMHAL